MKVVFQNGSGIMVKNIILDPLSKSKLFFRQYLKDKQIKKGIKKIS